MKRLPFLDGLRGALAVLVMASHVFGLSGSPLLNTPAHLAVDVFFLMSGFVLARAYDGRAGAFLVKRFVRLWPLFAACLCVGGLAVHHFPAPGELFWYPLLQVDARPIGDGVAWSLFFEAWAAPCLIPIFVVRHRLGRVALAALSPLLILVDPRFQYAPLFAVGAALALYDVRLPARVPGYLLWLGDISYSLYLTHFIVLLVLQQAFGASGLMFGWPLVFPVAWAAWWLIERPSIDLSRRIRFDSLALQGTPA